MAIDFALAPIDKTQAPHHILRENMYDLFDIENYNGQNSADNFMDFSTWRMSYAQVLSGGTSATIGLPGIAQLNTDYDLVSNNGAINIVSVALINYGAFVPNALTNNLVSYSNGQFFDVAGRTSSPYISKTMFIAATENSECKYGKYTLQFKPSLCYTNTGLSVSNIQVNFDNGAGFVNATFNTNLIGTYTSIGNKNVIIKITYSNGIVYQCTNKIWVEKIITTSTNIGGRYLLNLVNNQLVPDIVLPEVLGVHSGGDLFIRRSINTRNLLGQNTTQFLKPLIVIEGFDMTNGNNFDDFIEEITAERTTFNENGNNLVLNNQLDDIGQYDLIFINYRDGMDDILRNARLLEQVLAFVNTNKAAGAQQNVVMGISMGGLVSRYCLADMVKGGRDPQTRLLITHDSPHQGANVPLSVQMIAQRLRSQNLWIGPIPFRLEDIVKKLRRMNVIINSPAATQMLLTRVINDNGEIAQNNWLNNVYRPMITFAQGTLVSYRIVATSQGSQCGVPIFAPYTKLLDISAGIGLKFGPNWLSLKLKVDLDMWAMPSLRSTDRILKFKAYLLVKILNVPIGGTWIRIVNNAPGNLPPLDGVPGGMRSIGAALPGFLQNTKFKFDFDIPGIFQISASYSANNFPSFCFVPVNSALDVDISSNSSNQFVLPITGLNGSRFTSYIAQEPAPEPTWINPLNPSGPPFFSSNLVHTDFQGRACHFIFNEMENRTDNVTCTQLEQCITNFDPQIIEEEEICKGIKIFKIINRPNFNNLVWSVTPPNAATLEPLTNNKVKVRAYHNVSYTLQASYIFCGNNQNTTASFINNLPQYNEAEIFYPMGGPETWCANTDKTFSVTDFGEGANYTWNYSSLFSLVLLSPDNKTIVLKYLGGVSVPENITCTASSYCYNTTVVSKSIYQFGDLLVKRIKTHNTSFQNLNSTNFIDDNHAYMHFQQYGVNINDITYELAPGSLVPEVWGAMASNHSQLFVYHNKTVTTTYNLIATLVNTDCGTTTTYPFSVTLEGNSTSGFTYQKIFTVAPNPFSNSLVINLNPNSNANSFLIACIQAGANIQVDIFNSFGAPVYGPVFSFASASTFTISGLQLLPGGQNYFIRIKVNGCPNSGIYQETHQILKL